jgi:hypothetical protein
VLIGIIALFVGAIYAYLIFDYMHDEDSSAKSQVVATDYADCTDLAGNYNC